MKIKTKIKKTKIKRTKIMNIETWKKKKIENMKKQQNIRRTYKQINK